MNLFHDTRGALRNWKRSPGYAIGALASIAVALAVNATVVAIVEPLIFTPPLGVANPERVVRAQNARLRRLDHYVQLAESLRFLTISAQSEIRDVSFDADGGIDFVRARFMTRNFLSVLGVTPHLGQVSTGGNDVIIIGHHFWQQRFGHDPNIVGKTARIDGRLRTIVGVTPKGFSGVDSRAVDVWLIADDAARSSDGFWIGGGLEPIGRLAADASTEQAAAELQALFPADAPIMSRKDGTGSQLELTIVWDTFAERLSKLDRLVLSLLGATGALLLIACANVSGLVVNCTTRRAHEIAVRFQLGATPAIIIKQLLTEILVLNIFAALLALLLAYWMGPVVMRVLGAPMPGKAVVSAFPTTIYGLELTSEDSLFHLPVLVMSSIVVLVATALSALAPALQIGRVDLNRWLRAKEYDRRQTRFRSVLLCVQVAITVVLLIGTGLFVRSLRKALSVEKGVDVTNVFIARLDQLAPDVNRVPTEKIVETVRSVPSVTSVSLSSSEPLTRIGKLHVATSIPGYEYPWGEQKPAGNKRAFVEAVSPEYFSLLGIRIVHGRTFSDELDKAGGPPVVIIDDTVARDVFRGENPLGRCIHFAYDPAAPGGLFKKMCRQVVGVATAVRLDIVRMDGLDEGEYDPAFYVPMAQWDEAKYLLIRTRTGVQSAAAEIVSRLQQVIDARHGQVRLERLSSYVDHQTHGWRLASAIFGSFGIAGLVVAAVGTYSLLTLIVAQSTREIGIRMALGGTPARVSRTIMANGMLLVVVGVALGLGSGVVLMRVTTALLFGITSTDAVSLGAAGILTLLVAFLASTIPSLRASRVDPAVSLRQE